MWQGLWSFPEFDEFEDREKYTKKLSLCNSKVEENIKLKHAFTHYKLDIDLKSITLKEKIQNSDNNKLWFNSNKIGSVGLPSPVIKVLKKIERNDTKSFL